MARRARSIGRVGRRCPSTVRPSQMDCVPCALWRQRGLQLGDGGGRWRLGHRQSFFNPLPRGGGLRWVLFVNALGRNFKPRSCWRYQWAPSHTPAAELWEIVQVKYVVLWRALTCPPPPPPPPPLKFPRGPQKEPIIGPPHCQGPRTRTPERAEGRGYLTFERFSPASLAPSSHEWHCLFHAAYGIIMHLVLAIASSLSLSSEFA